MRKAWVQAASISSENGDDTDENHQLAIPIKVRGNVIGVIQTHKEGKNSVWTDKEKMMLETITEQLGVVLESARLFEETQKRASREQLMGEVSNRMRESLDIETVLKNATQEIFQAIKMDNLEIRLAPQESLIASDDNNSRNENK